MASCGTAKAGGTSEHAAPPPSCSAGTYWWSRKPMTVPERHTMWPTTLTPRKVLYMPSPMLKTWSESHRSGLRLTPSGSLMVAAE